MAFRMTLLVVLGLGPISSMVCPIVFVSLDRDHLIKPPPICELTSIANAGEQLGLPTSYQNTPKIRNTKRTTTS